MKGSNLILFNLRKNLRKYFAEIIAKNMKNEPLIYTTTRDCYRLCVSCCWGIVEALITHYPERKEVYNFPAVMGILSEEFTLACSDI